MSIETNDQGSEIPQSTVARAARMVSIPMGLAGRGALGIGRQLVGQSSNVVFAEIQEKTAEQLFKSSWRTQRWSDEIWTSALGF